MDTDLPHRPFGVTVLVVLLWIQAIFGIIAGIIFVIESDNAGVVADTGLSDGGVTALGVVAIIVGLITAWVASALGRGSRIARGIVAVLAVLHLIYDAYALIEFSAGTRIGALVSALISIAILYFLYGERGSDEFFGGDRTDTRRS